jgi:monovalent cation:H+ antiporter-2, CPA2 family
VSPLWTLNLFSVPVFFLASAATPPFLVESAALLVSGAIIAYVCYRLGLVPIVGFLVAGVVIGPHALGLVREQALVDAVAEVGVILLLYTIGIEFSLDKLARIRTLILGGGTLQVVFASVATMGVLGLIGVPWQAGLFTGFLVALSSTAIVLKILADRGETNSTFGQASLGLLIFQDLAIIVMVLLVPMLAGRGGGAGEVGAALGRAAAIIAGVLIVARRVMPPLLERVARTCSPELFLLTVVSICFGTAYLTSLAGVSVSLGAFLAGLVVSESKFSQHAFAEIMPLQILFSATFFVSVGMLLDVGFLLQHLPAVMGAVVLVALVKVATTAASVLILGYRLPVAMAAGLTLAQVGEFSFVLERAGRDLGLSPAGLGEAGAQTFIATTVLLMMATPLMTQLGARFAARLEARRNDAERAVMADSPAPAHAITVENHVIVAGYGDAARQLVRVLHGSRIPYVITTLSPGGALEAEAEGLPVIRGDASKAITLQHAGIERAKMLVIADDDPATAHRIAAVARPLAPTARIVVRTRYVAEIESLRHAGVERVIAEELESVVQLFADVLRDYAIGADEIQTHEDAIRNGGYAVLRTDDAPATSEPVVVCRLDGHCLSTRRVVLREGMAAVGCRIDELGLDALGLTLVAARRQGAAVDVPASGRALEAGDEIELSGSAHAFTAAAALFRTEAAASSLLPVAAPDTRRVDTSATITLTVTRAGACTHVDSIRAVRPTAPGCEECLRTGDAWVHLRVCMTCGHVGCCDSSKNKHATAHHRLAGHPIMRSLEPGERWGWCYVDDTLLE